MTRAGNGYYGLGTGMVMVTNLTCNIQTDSASFLQDVDVHVVSVCAPF